MFYEVIPEKLFRKDAGILTYSFDSPLAPGTIVEIPLGKTNSVGVILKKVAQPNFATKSISKILYTTPLPTHLLKTMLWMSEYYMTPLPTILNLILPKGITKNRRKTTEKTEQESLNTPKIPLIELNNAQKTALKALQEGQEATKLLHGVTGSGKTNIYLEMAKNALEAGKSTILLVPEIALTSQLVRVFEETFGQKVTLIHSRQTEAERHKIWEDLLMHEGWREDCVLRGHPQFGEDAVKGPVTTGALSVPEEHSLAPARIIIGPRSALFAPISNLGLIIIDESHESTYFQENTPKYSTLRLASFIAKPLKIPCIQGSATPLIQDYYIAKAKNSIVKIDEKAKKTAIDPTIKIIDFKDRANFTKNRYFCTNLLNSITENLKNHEQTLIFHNRRGSAPLSLCENCGEEFLCPTCLLPLNLHADTYELICHTCGFKQKVPHVCPKCGSPNILHKGFGTKLLETELKKLFKDAKVARFDADNNKNDSLDALYDDVKSGKIDIIIGTQTVAKGLDLPKLATVGIVQADAGLSLPDYSAEERTFELVTQVIGRVGRGHLDKAEVFIQTFQPDSEVLKTAIKADYDAFSEYTLKKRKISGFPPFTYIAKLDITYKTEAIAVKKIRETYKTLSKNKELIVSVPTPSFHEHTIRGYTWQLIVRAKSRQKLLTALKDLDQNVRVTLDPPSLL